MSHCLLLLFFQAFGGPRAPNVFPHRSKNQPPGAVKRESALCRRRPYHKLDPKESSAGKRVLGMCSLFICGKQRVQTDTLPPMNMESDGGPFQRKRRSSRTALSGFNVNW